MTVSEVLMNEDSGGRGEGEGPHLHSSHLQQDCDYPIGGLFSPLSTLPPLFTNKGQVSHLWKLWEQQ